MNITEPLQNGRKTWIVVESLAGSGIISNIQHKNVQIVLKDDLRDNPSLRFQQGEKIIISTETVLDDVLQRLDEPEKQDLISTLKNKVGCRRMLTALFPVSSSRRSQSRISRHWNLTRTKNILSNRSADPHQYIFGSCCGERPLDR